MQAALTAEHACRIEGNSRLLQTAYGLTITSELALPELPMAVPGAVDADVSIRFGKLSADGLGDAARIGPISWANGDELQLAIPHIARFRASAGSSIVIDPEPGIDEDSVRVFLLGSVLGALLLQRGLLLLHGCAVDVDGKALIAVGPSGAGKSTLAEGFRRRGHAVLSDDLVAINGAGHVIPGIPRIKLWHDVTEHLSIDRSNLPRIRPNLEKFGLLVSQDMAAAPIPAGWVYGLSTHHAEGVIISPLNGFHCFNLLRENSYRASFVKGLGRRPQHLAQATQLAGRIKANRVERPNSGFTLDPLIDALLADARG